MRSTPGSPATRSQRGAPVRVRPWPAPWLGCGQSSRSCGLTASGRTSAACRAGSPTSLRWKSPPATVRCASFSLRMAASPTSAWMSTAPCASMAARPLHGSRPQSRAACSSRCRTCAGHSSGCGASSRNTTEWATASARRSSRWRLRSWAPCGGCRAEGVARLVWRDASPMAFSTARVAQWCGGACGSMCATSTASHASRPSATLPGASHMSRCTPTMTTVGGPAFSMSELLGRVRSNKPADCCDSSAHIAFVRPCL
mmetsp:Transcript_98683/g.318207  ORF Transcript_98683/g.318207 Transcript_98683/m.318207 type:complete len:257 (-) Transcript_98683:9-779(-)